MKPDAGKSNVVLYDDECSLCTFQMRVVTWLDWFNTVSLLPISHPRAAESAPAISREQLQEAIHCIAGDGQIYRGARCLRFIGMRMPLAVPVSAILYLPGIIWIAERIYMWISRHRQLLSRLFGCQGACRIMPGRQRAQDHQNDDPNQRASKNTAA